MADVPNASYEDAGDYAKPIIPIPAAGEGSVMDTLNEDLADALDAVGVSRDWHPASEESEG
jgi:hypothetical protein